MRSDDVDGIVALDVVPVDASHLKVSALLRDFPESIADNLREHGVDGVVQLALMLRPRHDR